MSKFLKEDNSGMKALQARLKEIQAGNMDAHVLVEDLKYDNGASTVEVAYFHEFGTEHQAETAWLRRATSPKALEKIVKEHEKEIKKILESNNPDSVPKGLAERLEKVARDGLNKAGLIDSGLLESSIKGYEGPPPKGE